MTPAEHLRAARKLITPEGAWTQGTNAKNVRGISADPSGRNAVCWCAAGALISINEDEIYVPIKLLSAVTGCRRITKWNDASCRTQAEVLAAFDAAIKLAEAQS